MFTCGLLRSNFSLAIFLSAPHINFPDYPNGCDVFPLQKQHQTTGLPGWLNLLLRPHNNTLFTFIHDERFKRGPSQRFLFEYLFAQRRKPEEANLPFHPHRFEPNSARASATIALSFLTSAVSPEYKMSSANSLGTAIAAELPLDSNFTTQRPLNISAMTAWTFHLALIFAAMLCTSSPNATARSCILFAPYLPANTLRA